MTERKKRLPGRPVSDNPLTPAQKQRAYRDRVRLKTEAQEVNFITTCDSFDQLKKRIADLETLLRITNESYLSESKQRQDLQSQVWELEVKLSKANKKSNVTKI